MNENIKKLSIILENYKDLNNKEQIYIAGIIDGIKIKNTGEFIENDIEFITNNQ